MEKCTLYVPEESIPVYAAKWPWTEFVNIKPLDESGIEDIVADDIPDRTDIYTVNGICVKHNAGREDIKVLPAGLYIIGGKKVLVK